MDKSILSVVIPCYNSGNYLLEAIESVQLSTGAFEYEIIIINDGSTDPGTLELFKKISTKNIKVIHQENRGPASARNTGIRAAQSEYILFLDSDNKIKPEFISTAINIFESNSEIDIVYGKPEFIGDFTGRSGFKTAPFDLEKIWFENYIDMCSVIRKSVWESLGMLDENSVLIGHEDWEFWIRAGLQKKKFYFIDEIMFEYRLRKNSLITQVTSDERYEKMIQYVYGKNYIYFQTRIQIHNELVLLHNNETNTPFKTFIKNIYRKYFRI